MVNLAKGLIVLAVPTFLVGVVVALTGGEVMRITAESFSRTCNHLIFFAIALIMISKK